MSAIKCFPNICGHIWDVCLILRWLPWHLNQINGFQLRKLEWHNTANVIRGLLGCRDPVAMATRRQAPKPSQKKKKKRKKRWLPWRVNYWRWCRRGATGTAASGVLGHSYPRCQGDTSWRQAPESCSPRQRNHGNRSIRHMRRPKTDQQTLRWLPQEVSDEPTKCSPADSGYVSVWREKNQLKLTSSGH